MTENRSTCGSGDAARSPCQPWAVGGLLLVVSCSHCTVLAAADPPLFADLARQSGLEFDHFNGMTGQYYFPEMTGQGGAVLDFDGDGDLDLYLVQGSLLGPGDTLADVLFPPLPGRSLTDRLYRNDSMTNGNGEPRRVFVDVTERAGIDAPGYGMGAAVGDIDGDGWPDLYVTNYGPNQLWRNRGDGSFEDVTAKSGTGDPLWGTSATFFDFDGDRDADLYLANYVVFDLEKNPRCFALSSRRDYCGPDAFAAQPDRLYRNLGQGVFEDVTSRVLVGYEASPGLGVTAADFNGDQRTDLYVANDGRANQLWVNRGDGTFVDEALFSGVALNHRGRPEASMGVDAADFDGDGDEDIFVTHLMGETNTLYVNDGSGLFEDKTAAHGMASASLPNTSFGTAWLDIDNDGLLDLLAANGAVRILEDQAAAGDPYPLKLPNQLLHNVGGRFEEISAAGGEVFAIAEVSRGISLGDLDNDGDVDVVLHNNNGPTRLLMNQVGSQVGWIGLGLKRPGAAIWETGVRFEALAGEAGARWRRSRADGSYCSANDSRVVLGLGTDDSIPTLRLHERDGRVREFRQLPGGRFFVFFPASTA